MRSLKSQTALFAAKATYTILKKVLKRNASQLPGRIAKQVDPNILQSLKQDFNGDIVVVCGTNGKTTTTNLIANCLEKSGRKVVCNRFGANMESGVISAFLGQKNANYAVIEADELSCKQIIPVLKPKYFVLLNLFRDQLDRAGEIDHIQDVLVNSLSQSPKTTLIVNGDDPLSVAVAQRCREFCKSIKYFGIDQDLKQRKDRVPEARFCQNCGSELDYHFHSYAQLGSFFCPSCGFKRPDLDFRSTEIEVSSSGIDFCVSSKSSHQSEYKLHTKHNGIYMVYNIMAVSSVCMEFNLTNSVVQETLDLFNPENGRLQKFSYKGREIILNLAKNPTGFNQNISLLNADGRIKNTLIIINDNFNDGKDVSWLWDVDFELLEESNNKSIFVSGLRGPDMQVRLKYAGISAEIVTSVGEALQKLDQSNDPLYVLTNYSALWPAKAELEAMVKE